MLKNIIKKILNPAFETLFSRTMSSAHQSKMEDKKLSEIYAPVKLQPPRHSLVWPTLKKAIPPSAPPVRQGKYWPVPLQMSLYGEPWGRRLAEHWWMLIRASQPVVKTTCQSYHGAPFISVSTFWLHNPFHNPLWVIKRQSSIRMPMTTRGGGPDKWTREHFIRPSVEAVSSEGSECVWGLWMGYRDGGFVRFYAWFSF